MSTKAKTFVTRLLITTVILYLIMPIFSRMISTFLTTYVYLLLILITVASIIFAKGMPSVNKYFSILLPFILWRFLLLLIQKSPIFEWGYGSVLALTPLLIGYAIIYRMGWKNQKYFSIMLIFALVITAITTIIGTQAFPGASRYLATVGSSEEAEFILYNWINLGGYDFVYYIVLLYPVLIYAFKIGRIPFVLMILSIVIVFLLILSSGYTTALLLFMVSTLFLFLKKNPSPRQIILFLLILALLFIILFPFFSSFLRFLSEKVPNELMADHLLVIANGKEGFEKTDDRRLDLYWLSISSFLKHPVSGGFFTKGAVNGGHSFLLDTLAQCGIVGLFILIWMYRKIYGLFYKPYQKSSGYGYIFWIFLQTVILSLVNTGMWISILCLFAPILINFFNHTGEVHD